MNPETKSALLLSVGAALLGGTAQAQDSTSLLNSFPGDALDPTSTTEQVNDYVVDVAAITSSSGRTYGVAPLAKAGWDYFTGNHNFFTASVSAQGISRRTLSGVGFVRNSYDYWNAPGTGVNGDATRNNPGTPIDTTALTGNQFGYMFSQFSSDDPTAPTLNFNSVVGGTVNYETTTPSRLYVSRIMGAGNDKTWLCNVSQFGVGSVDADGWITVRADGFGAVSCGGYNTFLGNNLFLIDLLARNSSAVNVLSQAGADDVGIHALVENTTVHSPTSIMPAAVTGGTPIILGSNWNGQFVTGSGPLSGTTAHRGPGVTDHRGNVSYCAESFPGVFGAGSTHGSAGILGQAGGTNTLNVWGLNSAAAPQTPRALTYPGNASISDPETGWAPAAGSATFTNYFSSTSFRGGNGQVAIGIDQAGRLLAAGTMEHPSTVGSTNANNMIAVARTANGTVVEWVVAAYTDGNDGKPVYGSFGTTVIGKLVAHEPGGSSIGGPALSCPMIDSVGNVYFNARVQLTGDNFYRESLVRAVYDPASFQYRCELILTEGDVVHGVNSDRNYMIQFLQVGGTSGSSPSMPFSQNMNQAAYNGQSTAGLDPSDTETIGGIVVRATVIYDTDQDGDYDTQSFDPLSDDQDYQVLLYITSATDCNENGVPDDIDLADGTSLDVNLDGVPDECGPGSGSSTCDCTGGNGPCFNLSGPGRGCPNSNPNGLGAMLTATGVPQISNDTLGFNIADAAPNKPGLIFAGDTDLGPSGLSTIPNSAGVFCVAGPNTVRGSVFFTDASGAASLPTFQSGGPYSTDPGVVAGQSRSYLFWYRDPGTAFGCLNDGPQADFNQSNGWTLTWVP